MTKQDLSDLLVRVEGATGEDSALSNAVCIATGVAWTEKRNDPGFVGEYMRGWYPNVTASLDAALALVTRVLPGWSWDTGCSYYPEDGAFVARAWPGPGRLSEGTGNVHAASPSLALLAAMLKALIEDGE